MKSPIRYRLGDELSLWWALVLVAVCGVLLVFAHPVHTLHNVVVQQAFADDPYYYCFQYENDLKGTPFCWHICKDYVSPRADFLEGKVFESISFVESEDCKSLNPDSQASYYERTVDGKPVFISSSQEGQGRQTQAERLTSATQVSDEVPAITGLLAGQGQLSAGNSAAAPKVSLPQKREKQ